MRGKVINIIIADASEIINEGLTGIIMNTGQHFEVHSASNLCELEQLNIKVRAEIIFINPSLIQNQVKLFQSLQKEFLGTQWIGILYSYADPNILSDLNATININDSRNSIISAIQKLLNAESQTENLKQLETLSDREIDVLKLLVEGNANKEIADKLNISTHTVISHRKNISQKTGIKSVSGLTIYAVVKNIISIDSYRE
jgi:DNA-binding NarL/FixJ family response regulator